MKSPRIVRLALILAVSTGIAIAQTQPAGQLTRQHVRTLPSLPPAPKGTIAAPTTMAPPAPPEEEGVADESKSAVTATSTCSTNVALPKKVSGQNEVAAATGYVKDIATAASFYDQKIWYLVNSRYDHAKQQNPPKYNRPENKDAKKVSALAACIIEQKKLVEAEGTTDTQKAQARDVTYSYWGQLYTAYMEALVSLGLATPDLPAQTTKDGKIIVPAKAAQLKWQCDITSFDTDNNPHYAPSGWLPIWRKGCTEGAVQDYFSVGNKFTAANQARYIYNTQATASQLGADLMTSTFGLGFQVVLSALATMGDSQPATDQSGTATPSLRAARFVTTRADGAAATDTSSDSVSNTISKLQQGGDFNIRGVLPLGRFSKNRFRGQLNLFPSVGFNVNGLGQNTITENTDTSGYIPIEGYGEMGSLSLPGQADAVFYGDVKYGLEIIPSKLANSIGTGSTFGLGNIAAGIEFAKSVRIGLQYFFGPSQAFCSQTDSGCTPIANRDAFKGMHFFVSFTPPTNLSK